MDRIQRAFAQKNAFITFLTAGDPSLEKTAEYILELERAGADLVEIGIPFSDPIAEGPVIQEADLRALGSGTTVDRIFEMVKTLRKKTQIPLVLMTYLNPVFHYGYEAFFERCREAQIDGIIIPDLPFEEKGEVESVCLTYGVTLISMIAPTSRERIRRIAGEARGFLYVVSSMGVTGVRSEITTDLDAILREIRSVTDVPAAVGFGIHTPDQAARIARQADGVIVGSALVKLIARYGDHAHDQLGAYTRMMKAAMQEAE
ncbi:MAG: tryptophan synthase subunit alpha [Eubacteriales bacterium]|nr:tryptophan synthase subunit alpha [Eubacteriales bacterium]